MDQQLRATVRMDHRNLRVSMDNMTRVSDLRSILEGVSARKGKSTKYESQR